MVQFATCLQKQVSTDLLQPPSSLQDCGSCMAASAKWIFFLSSCYLSSTQHSTRQSCDQNQEGTPSGSQSSRICHGRALELTE